MDNYKRILILAPHTDDGELGCGASINKWISQGKEVFYYAFSAAEESVPPGFPKDALRKEVINATKKLGINIEENVKIDRYPVRKLSEYRQEILEKLVKLNQKFKPDLVLLPSQNDIHQDHQIISNEGLRAFKNKSILAYELPWNNLTFGNVCFSILDEKDVRAKYDALQCYNTQKHREYLSEDYIYSWAKFRGTQVKKDYAECFEVLRLII
ncbi:PIG-L deacetylase family protein [Oceanobacillus sp. CAU 1775]